MSRSKHNPTHSPFVRGHVPRERGGSPGVGSPFHRANSARTVRPQDARGLTRRELRELESYVGRTPESDQVRAASTYRAAKRAALRTGPHGGRTRTAARAKPGQFAGFPQFLGRGFYVPAGPHANLGRRPYRKERYPHEAGYPNKYRVG
jgi:hypothetical protein